MRMKSNEKLEFCLKMINDSTNFLETREPLEIPEFITYVVKAIHKTEYVDGKPVVMMRLKSFYDPTESFRVILGYPFTTQVHFHAINHLLYEAEFSTDALLTTTLQLSNFDIPIWTFKYTKPRNFEQDQMYIVLRNSILALERSCFGTFMINNFT